MTPHYLVSASLRIESKTRALTDLVDAVGEPDLKYEIGDRRSKKIIRLGLHEKNGLIFNSRVDTTKSADAHVADLVRIAKSVPKRIEGVDLRILLFIQTSGPHNIQLADATLRLLVDNKLTVEISFD